jgi:hypothetical protein
MCDPFLGTDHRKCLDHQLQIHWPSRQLPNKPISSPHFYLGPQCGSALHAGSRHASRGAFVTLGTVGRIHAYSWSWHHGVQQSVPTLSCACFGGIGMGLVTCHRCYSRNVETVFVNKEKSCSLLIMKMKMKILQQKLPLRTMSWQVPSTGNLWTNHIGSSIVCPPQCLRYVYFSIKVLRLTHRSMW